MSNLRAGKRVCLAEKCRKSGLGCGYTPERAGVRPATRNVERERCGVSFLKSVKSFRVRTTFAPATTSPLSQAENNFANCLRKSGTRPSNTWTIVYTQGTKQSLPTLSDYRQYSSSQRLNSNTRLVTQPHLPRRRCGIYPDALHAH